MRPPVKLRDVRLARLPVKLRAARLGVETERNLVLSTWLRSECDAPVGRWLGSRYYQVREPYLKETVIPRSTITIAHLPGSDDAIVGWMASEHGVPLMLFVKMKFDEAKLDVETQLLAALEAA
jgi:hypothetical protein